MKINAHNCLPLPMHVLLHLRNNVAGLVDYSCPQVAHLPALCTACKLLPVFYAIAAAMYPALTSDSIALLCGCFNKLICNDCTIIDYQPKQQHYRSNNNHNSSELQLQYCKHTLALIFAAHEGQPNLHGLVTGLTTEQVQGTGGRCMPQRHCMLLSWQYCVAACCQTKPSTLSCSNLPSPITTWHGYTL